MSSHSTRNPVSVNRGSTTHGMTKLSEYGIWSYMKQRCYNPKEIGYPRYGGRGIRVCDRWLNSFPAFYEDMGPRPSPAHTLDRIDSTKDYSPDNCRWATRTEQNNNRSCNVILEYDGLRLTISQWSERLGIKYVTLYRRYSKGWSVADILTRPVDQRRLGKPCHSAKAP